MFSKAFNQHLLYETCLDQITIKVEESWPSFTSQSIFPKILLQFSKPGTFRVQCHVPGHVERRDPSGVHASGRPDLRMDSSGRKGHRG